MAAHPARVGRGRWRRTWSSAPTASRAGTSAPGRAVHRRAGHALRPARSSPAARSAYDRVDPDAARELFVHHALVEGDWDDPPRVPRRQPRRSSTRLGRPGRPAPARRPGRRRRAVPASTTTRVGADVVSGRHFDRGGSRPGATSPTCSRSTWPTSSGDGADGRPGRLPRRVAPGRPGAPPHLPVRARRRPTTASPSTCPLAVLNQVEPAGFDWQVPGFRDELVVALVRSLPKALRRHLSPLAETAEQAVAERGIRPPWAPGYSPSPRPWPTCSPRWRAPPIPPEALDARRGPAAPPDHLLGRGRRHRRGRRQGPRRGPGPGGRPGAGRDRRGHPGHRAARASPAGTSATSRGWSRSTDRRPRGRGLPGAARRRRQRRRSRSSPARGRRPDHARRRPPAGAAVGAGRACRGLEREVPNAVRLALARRARPDARRAAARRHRGGGRPAWSTDHGGRGVDRGGLRRAPRRRPGRAAARAARGPGRRAGEVRGGGGRGRGRARPARWPRRSTASVDDARAQLGGWSGPAS